MTKIAICALLIGLTGMIWYERARIDRLHGRSAELRRRLLQAHREERNLKAVSSNGAESIGYKESAIASNSVGGPMETLIRDLALKNATMENWLLQHPEQRIPEFQYLKDADWTEEVGLATRRPLQSDEDFRLVAAALRGRAMDRFGSILSSALKAYVVATGGTLPNEVDQLVPYLGSPVDPAVFRRYQMLMGGLAPTDGVAATMAIGLSPHSVVDDAYDRLAVTIGVAGIRVASTYRLTISQEISREKAEIAYAAAHGGQSTTDAQQLIPYFQNSNDARAFQQLSR